MANKSDYLNHSDEELVRLCNLELPYNTSAYEILITRYDPLVFQFCLRYLRSENDAEEVVQEVFLRVFHHIARFERRSSFKTWLMRITTNQCSKRYNKLKKRREVEESFKEENFETQEHAYIENGTNDELVLQILNEMKNDDKEILSLRHLVGLSLTEVSEILGISNSAAKMRHQRAAARFQEIFKKRNENM